MKIAVISDIHGNLSALQAVLAHIQEQNIEHIHCLGDVVGYGPYPRECLNLITKHTDSLIMGNHEDALAHEELLEDLTRHAIEGLVFARKELSDANIQGLKSLKRWKKIPCLDIVLSHGSMTGNKTWHYVINSDDAEQNLKKFDEKILFIGHTHSPFLYGSLRRLYNYVSDGLDLSGSQRYIINVGSVGQPRDGDVRASYVTLDFVDNSKKGSIILDMHRVPYDIAQTEQAMKEKGLSRFLSDRLYRGE